MTPQRRLVRRHDFLRAAEALALEGVARVDPDRRRGWSTSFGKAHAVQLENGSWIDLHQSIIGGFAGEQLGEQVLFANPSRFRLADREFLALPRDLRWIHACLHALTSAGLHSLMDVPVLTNKLGDDMKPATELCDQLRIGAIVGVGYERACRRLLIDQDPTVAAWIEGQRPKGAERLAALLARRTRGGASTVSQAIALPPKRWPALFGPMLFPDKTFRAYHHRTLLSHWRLGWNRINGR